MAEKEAPPLCSKEILQGDRTFSCNAFRTGTKNISTTISTVIYGHQWEGVCVNQVHRDDYEKDPQHGLDDLLFVDFLVLKCFRRVRRRF